MDPRLIPYWIVNVLGSLIAVVVISVWLLAKRGIISENVLKAVLVVFALLIITYGAYQLYFIELLRQLYPGSYYFVGGCIAIILGAIVLFRIIWNLYKSKQ